MRKLKLYLHTSLDGFVAGKNGEMNWISLNEEQFDFVGKQTHASDTYLLGRATFQMMEAYWPSAGNQPQASKHDVEHSAWYNRVEKVVVSNSMQGTGSPNVKVINGDLKKQIEELKQSPGKDIIMFGSISVAHALMQLDLIDEYGLFINPVLLGGGLPAFQNITQSLLFTRSHTQYFETGVVGLVYERRR